MFDEDPCQSKTQLTETLNVTQQYISKRLHRIGMVQKKVNWLPHDLTERAMERRKTMCEILIKGGKGKVFFIVSSLVTKSGFIMTILNAKKHEYVQLKQLRRSQMRIFMAVNLCFPYGGIRIVSYFTRSWNRKKPSLLIATYNKWSNWIVLSKIKDHNIMEDTIRLFCSMITPGSISRKQFRKPYKYSTRKSYLTRHIHQTLLHLTATCFDPCTVSFQGSSSVSARRSQNGSTNGLLPRNQIFFIAESICCLKNGKTSYFTMESILNEIYNIVFYFDISISA